MSSAFVAPARATRPQRITRYGLSADYTPVELGIIREHIRQAETAGVPSHAIGDELRLIHELKATFDATLLPELEP